MFYTIGLTLALGTISIAVSKTINRTFVSACSVYWSAWLLALLSAYYAAEHALIPHASYGSLAMINTAHVGAFVGFLIASMISGPARRSISQRTSARIVRLASFTNRNYKIFFVFLFLVGCAHLLYRLSNIGIHLPHLMTDLRLHFLETRLSPLGKFTAYMFTGVPVLAILFGIGDAISGVRMHRVVALTIIGATHGLAMGGRGFLLGPFLSYGASFLLMSGAIKGRYVRSFVKKSITFVTVVLGIFVALGAWRWGVHGGDKNGIFFIMLNMITSWIGLSIPAVEPFVNVMADMPLRLGGNIFDWPVAQLERIGILDSANRDAIWSVVMQVRMEYGLVGNAPPTIIPGLVGDFGITFMPIYMGILMGLAHIATIKLRGGNLIGHMIATMALLAAFGTIQCSWFLNSGNCLALIWGFVFLFVMKQARFAKVRHLPTSYQIKGQQTSIMFQ